MASSIDVTKPTAGSATTASVRQNFTYAKSEIEALQAGTAITALDDSKVNVLLNATGTVTRTQESKNADTVSVFDFMTTAQIADVQAGTLLVDVSAPLQAAVNSRKSLYFPAGKYRIVTTLAFPTTFPPGGGWWRGDGMNYSDPQTSTRLGPMTALFFDGTVGGTLFEGQGLAGWEFSHMCFVGRPTAGSGNRAGILAHFKMDATFGASTYAFRQCRFEDSDVCVQGGVVTGDTNCDTFLFDQCIIANSTRGLVSKNSQGLLYTFTQLLAVSTTNVIDLENGGHLVINQANFATCGGAGATDFAIRLRKLTTNTQIAVLTDLRIEQNTRKVLQAADAQGRILINGYNEANSSDQNDVMFDTQGVTLEFHSARFLSNDPTTRPFKLTQGAGAQRTAMTFKNCSFAASTFALTDWFELTAGSQVAVKIEDSTYNDGTVLRLPYINSQPEWGDVTHFGQTTNATLTSLYFFGTTNNTAFQFRVPSGSLWEVDAHIIGRKTPTATSTVTITNASPGVVTWNAHGLANDDPVYFTTTGALPTGLSVRTLYYVRNQAANTFEVSATPGGASINTSSAGSGVHTAVHTHDVMFHRRLLVQDTAGVTVQCGPAQTIGTDQNPRALTAPTIDVQNSFIRAQVTGLASTTFNWRVTYKLNRLLEAST